MNRGAPAEAEPLHEQTSVAPSVPAPSRRRRVAIRVGKAALWVLVGYYAMCVAVIVIYRFVPPPITALQLQRCVETWFGGRRCHLPERYVSYASLPAHVGRAVVAAEDGRF